MTIIPSQAVLTSTETTASSSTTGNLPANNLPANNSATSNLAVNLPAVYGVVQSWRFGKSLGIDPIGSISTCSFDCVYCQLGEIERKTHERQLFVPTSQILAELAPFAPWDVDTITLSGSGEPTLAENLKEIITAIKELTHKPVGVLTNGSLLGEEAVRDSLCAADWVAVKVDAMDEERLYALNRPSFLLDLFCFWKDLTQFRAEYQGKLVFQTMLLLPWNAAEEARYLEAIYKVKPNLVQLNTPSRPKPLRRTIAGRGNDQPEGKMVKRVSEEYLAEFAERIERNTHVPVQLKSGEGGVRFI